MKHKTTLKCLTLLMLISMFSFDLSAVGLQDYLQNTDTVATTPSISSPSGDTNISSQLTQIIEFVVAGIVASALILTLLVMFLGRWAGNREKKAIKAIRIEVDQEKEHIISAATTVREQEKETTKLVRGIRDEVEHFTSSKDLVKKYENEIIETTVQAKSQEQKLEEITNNISDRLDGIQAHWEKQLDETVSTIKLVQGNLEQNLSSVNADIEKMQNQKVLSQELLQDFLDRHNKQSDLINKNTGVSDEVSQNLEETLIESKQLVQLLKQHQENAEKSLKSFTEELTVYEEQAYEQFDTSFQVADLARQELSANVDESRKHIETMRRHEEQSHNINSQTQKNLEQLDYSKIMKLSHTLDSTQDLFSDMHSRVEDAKNMLDELRDIETDIRTTANNVEDYIDSAAEKKASVSDDISEGIIEPENLRNETESLLDDEHLKNALDNSAENNVPAFDVAEYKMASGYNAPISFFKNIKNK